MCVAEQVKSGLHPRVTSKKRLADQLLLRAYTCVLQNRSNQGCTQGSTCYQGSADQVLLQAYICVLQNIKAQGFTQGSTVTKDCPTTGCCRHTHVCRRTNQCRVAPRVKVYKGLADHMLLGAYTCVLQNRRNQGCTQGSEVTKVWPSSCCCEHTQEWSLEGCTQGSRVAKALLTKCCCEHTRVYFCTQGSTQGFADQLLL